MNTMPRTLARITALGMTTLFLAAAPAIAASDPPRSVQGHTVISTALPAVRVQVPASSVYLGSDAWRLFGYDDVDLYAFIDKGPNGKVERLYWVQFEAYIPERPELAHDYKASRRLRVDGIDFYLDTWVRGSTDKAEPGSDIEHLEKLLAGKGYHLPREGMYVRLVHLPDARKRHELMVIYAEDLAPTGFSAAQLDKGGSKRPRWPDIERQLIQRARKRVTFKP